MNYALGLSFSISNAINTYNLFGIYLTNGKPLEVLLLFMILFAVIFEVFFSKIRNYVTVICTSYMGAYMSVRGLSIIIGHFPDEKLILSMISKEEMNQLERTFTNVYVFYLGAILILWLTGGFIQLWFQQEEEKIKESKLQDTTIIQKNDKKEKNKKSERMNDLEENLRK
jgi:hypothetical protein